MNKQIQTIDTTSENNIFISSKKIINGKLVKQGSITEKLFPTIFTDSEKCPIKHNVIIGSKEKIFTESEILDAFKTVLLIKIEDDSIFHLLETTKKDMSLQLNFTIEKMSELNNAIDNLCEKLYKIIKDYYHNVLKKEIKDIHLTFLTNPTIGSAEQYRTNIMTTLNNRMENKLLIIPTIIDSDEKVISFGNLSLGIADVIKEINKDGDIYKQIPNYYHTINIPIIGKIEIQPKNIKDEE